MNHSALRTRLSCLICGLALGLTAGCKADDARTKAETAQTTAEQAAAEPKAAEPTADAPAETPEAQLRERLAGDWHIDLGSLEKDPQFAELPPQQRMQALTMARQMMADVSFSFTADGKVRLGFGPTGRAGTYTVDEVDGTALHVTTRTQGAEGETVEKAILRIEGDAMWVTEGADGRTIRLLRGKPPTSQPTSQPAAGGPASQPTGGPASQPTRPASQPTRPASQPASQPARLPPGHPPAGRAAPASQPKMPPPQPAK